MKPLQTFLTRLATLPKAMTGAKDIAGATTTKVQRQRRAPAIDIAATIEQAMAAAGLRPKVDRRDAIDAIDAPSVASDGRSTSTERHARANAGRNSDASRQQRPADASGSDVRLAVASGRSLARRFSNAAGARDYTLYVPAGLDAGVPAPLLLMLHGCTQDPADFAVGTRMNALAEHHGVLVAYPAQTTRDNGSRCWNWFRRQDQARGAGEPSILAGIVAEIASDHRVDRDRVYVAGLSAGAAMAVILGRTYPDVFAAVGAHSGLPHAAAQDVPGAFAAMQGNRATARDRAHKDDKHPADPMPTIVFHGDADRTVDARNGTAIVDDAIAGAALAPLRTEATTNSRAYTRDVFSNAVGRAIVEHWILHGSGHAWSGGDAAGSHADALGPDASAEMLRFFLQHRRQHAA